MRRRRPSPAERGFTLLELLIAMTLLGMLMVVFSGSVRLGMRVWERTEAGLDETSQALVLASFLKDRIEQAVPLVRPTAEGFAPVFEGGHDRLRLASSMPISLGAGLYLLELAHVDDPASERDGGRLVLRWRRHGEDGGESDLGERTLSAGVTDLSISYFGGGADGAPADWRQQWRDRERLPALIRIELAFARDRPDRPMTLTAAPMVDEWYDVAF